MLKTLFSEVLDKKRVIEKHCFSNTREISVSEKSVENIVFMYFIIDLSGCSLFHTDVQVSGL